MKWLKMLFLTLITVFIITFISMGLLLQGSVPQLDGAIPAPSLTHPVTLQRDQYGMVLIQAQTQTDAFYAQGVAHAQDRFFQMDLLRRNAAGELSALFGKGALARDKLARFHQFRARAKAAFSHFPQEQQAMITAYTKGVNDTIEQYTVKPFEYLLTGASMQPWQHEDSLLVIYSMYMDLQSSQVERDLTLTHLHDQYGAAMVHFLLSPSPYQAALDGSIIPENTRPIPNLSPASEADTQASETTNKATSLADKQLAITQLDGFEEADIGSNNWAVSDVHTNNQHALLANDMHLGLNLPAIWYRAQLSYPHAGKDITVVGVSLPGAPGIIVGSNLHAAWGFTNANVDNVDWIALPDEYPTTFTTEVFTTPDGDESMRLELSEYGPVKTINNKKFALKWVAHTPYAVSFDLLALAHANTTQALIDVAKGIRIPVQNMMMADRQGNIAYRLTGAVTARSPLQHHAISPEQFSSIAALWDEADRNTPIYANPNYNKLWSANARVLSTNTLARFGDGGYALGPRGVQIANRLKAQNTFDEADFLALQLDNRAIFMKKWRNILLSTLTAMPQTQQLDPVIKGSIDALTHWQACACKDDIGYTLARHFRTQVMVALSEPFLTSTKAAGLKFSPINRHLDTAMTRIVSEQPLSWLPSGYDNYAVFMQDMFMQTLDSLARKTQQPRQTLDLQLLKWGNVNALKIRHPISRQIPLLASMIDMPEVAGFGDSFMPAVQNGTHGASQRFIIQPGLEQHAYMSLPGGQSGHPLSAFYTAGFEVYAAHQGLPLLFQSVNHTLTLSPN